MENFIKAAVTSDFEDGIKKKVLVQGNEILIARVDGKYYAVDNRCPHMGGDLSAGKLEGTIITCPRHSSRFDLSDGKVVRWLKGSGMLSAIGKALKSPRPIKTYNVKIEDDAILIEI